MLTLTKAVMLLKQRKRALRSSVHRGDGEFLRVQWESHSAESSGSGCIVLSHSVPDRALTTGKALAS